MRDTSTFTLQDHQRIAHAFLALTDDLSPEAVQRSLIKIASAFAAVLVLALAAPMTWLSPAPVDQPEQGRRPARRHAGQLEGLAGRGRRRGRRRRRVMAPRPGRETVGGQSTVAEPPPWERAHRPRPTWGLVEGDAIAPGRTVLRRIGGGKRFEVFLVWDEHRLAVLVAKVLRPDHAEDPAAPRDLVREGDLLERIAHPVVVRGFGVAAEGRSRTWCSSTSRARRCRRCWTATARSALEQLLPLGMHTASALHYLAREGVVHLDVKPDNLVMGAPPRLIDFSVSRGLAAAARLTKPVGTDAYMAPEQCDRSRGELGPAADVFGLGVTLFRAHAGEPPFPRAEGAGLE